MTGHTDSVTSIATVRDQDGASLIIVSTSADGTLKVWKENNEGVWSVFQDIRIGSQLIETIALTSLPKSNIPLLAFGTVDNNVKVYTASTSTHQFEHVATLTGHEDWIRCLSFATTDEGEILLASGSQDKRIRLWRFTRIKGKIQDRPKKLDPAKLLSELYETEEGDIINWSQHGTSFPIGEDYSYNITLESVILGHEDRVYSVKWIPTTKVDGKKRQQMRLLSASMDRSMVVWEPDQGSGVWIEAARVGEIGGNHLGFFGCLYGPEGRYILGHGYNGAFQLWEQVFDEEGEENWEPRPTISGHFEAVMDISWDPKKNYFVSVSKDQTARLWAKWNHELKSTSRWHEIARPQIHGHDLSCMTFQNGVDHRFISGAEEKVLRVFDAPKSFLTSLKNISQVEFSQSEFNERADSANLPALGLSNKPVYEEKEIKKNLAETVYDEIHEGGGYGGDITGDKDVAFHSPLILEDEPPVETYLRQRLHWPESHKLYGHGNELICVTSSTQGDILASSCACKTQNQYQAGIRIWDTKDWKEVNELSGHSLTVTSLEFSHNDKYLLSGSRGRSLCIHKREEGSFDFKLAFSNLKAHLRIIWSVGWSHDDLRIATGSRDKSVKIWRIQDDGSLSCIVEETLKLSDSVTSVSWAPKVFGGKYILAIGFENGKIEFWSRNITGDNVKWVSVLTIDGHNAHVETVRKIVWGNTTDTSAQVLSCSTDCSIRLFNIQFS